MISPQITAARHAGRSRLPGGTRCVKPPTIPGSARQAGPTAHAPKHIPSTRTRYGAAKPASEFDNENVPVGSLL